jgi:hypothetical protein
MHPLPDTPTAPSPERMGDGLVGRELFREHTPLAPAPPQVKNGMHHLAQVSRTRATARFGGWNERREDRPFCLGDLRRVALRHPMPSIAGSKRANLTTPTPFQTGSQKTGSLGRSLWGNLEEAA